MDLQHLGPGREHVRSDLSQSLLSAEVTRSHDSSTTDHRVVVKPMSLGQLDNWKSEGEARAEEEISIFCLGVMQAWRHGSLDIPPDSSVDPEIVTFLATLPRTVGSCTDRSTRYRAVRSRRIDEFFNAWSDSESETITSSSEYSDWEMDAGTGGLAPPLRNRRRTRRLLRRTSNEREVNSVTQVYVFKCYRIRHFCSRKSYFSRKSYLNLENCAKKIFLTSTRVILYLG